MQGRLSPMIDGKVQSFPAATWREEFPLAQACGFSLIEWVFDAPDWTDNPIVTAAGRREIRELAESCQLAVPVLCADYFMHRPLTSGDDQVRREARGVLEDLIQNAAAVGLRQIELPCIGAASLKSEPAASEAIAIFNSLAPLLETHEVDLLLEVDLGPSDAARLFEQLTTPRVGMNYDTGNSAWWGFNPVEEFAAYGPWIRNVHIKDTTKKDYSVPLGSGEVDFDLTFGLLRDVKYAGDFILQTARQADDEAAARQFAAFPRRHIERYLA